MPSAVSAPLLRLDQFRVVDTHRRLTSVWLGLILGTVYSYKMYALIYLVMTVVMCGVKITAQSNRFATKNSYNASLELWTDEAGDDEEQRLRACCRPVQVI